MTDPIRCPALHVARIEDNQVKERWRCEKPTGHGKHHEAKGTKWTFAVGSYHGISPGHPDYFVTVEASE